MPGLSCHVSFSLVTASGSHSQLRWVGFSLQWLLVAERGLSSCGSQTLEHSGCGSQALGEGDGNPLQYSCLENPMDGGAWWAAVHGVARSWTRLSDFTLTFHFHALEKEMLTHSSVLAWRIPGTGEPGGLPSLGLHRVGHDWRDLAAAAESSGCGSRALERRSCGAGA